MLLLVALFALAAASPARVYPEYTTQLPAPAGWVVDMAATQARAKPILRLQVMLSRTPGQVRRLQTLFDTVSDPRHPNYAQYKTLDEMNTMLAPPRAQVAAVQSFLKQHGLRYEMVGTDMLRAFGLPEHIDAAFHTEMRLFKHAQLNMTAWRSVIPYSVPASLEGHIDFISGVHHFPTRHTTKFFTPADAPLIGPLDLRTRYNVTDYTASYTNNTQAVAEFQGQYYSPSDLVQFFASNEPGYSSQVAGVIGPNQPNAPGVEAELDIQYIMGVNPNCSTYFYSQASFEFWDDLTAWIAILKADPKPPLVHSISYGEQAEHQTSEAYKKRFDQEMQVLGTRGITIIFASGDSGTGCSLCYRFDPSFPATSPSLTCVGATQFDQASPPYTSESAVNQFGSGGGFSWTFPRPAYQNAAVASYFKYSQPSHLHFNSAGRATPDVAALGIGFGVVVNGGIESIGGTSAAAPTFAAIVSILNDQQLKAGKKPLGFLNPWLYQTAAATQARGNGNSAFWDVTNGGNQDGCCLAGFHCQPGYDAVTGLGTPNYRVLKQNLP